MNSTIRLGYFYRTLPLMAAQRHGFYRRHGVEVQEERVRSSTQQFEYLLDGRYDVVQTSPDNVANYRYNTGHALGDRIDVQGFLGMDYGLNLVLVARPGIRSARTLKAVAVDAPDSGFAYVAYAILERAGLKRGKHYDVVPVGGVSQRFQRLLSGDAGFDATLLSGGFETRAANSSYRILGRVREVADPYVGAWTAATGRWLSENGPQAAAFAAAYREATAWCFDPDNGEACLAMLMETPDTSRSLAEQLYRIQLQDEVGNIPDADVVAEGVGNVLALRARYGGFEQDVDPDLILRDGELYRLLPSLPSYDVS